MRHAHSFRRTVRVTLAAGLAVSLCIPFMSSAASSTSQEDGNSPSNLGTISVTGTRIKRSNVATAQPVVRISHDELVNTGFKSVGQILTNMPSVGYVSGGFASDSFTGTGADQISLHYLGSNRLLVLLNGKRLAAGFGGAVDLNQIPLAAVDHIEILQDGASAVYGSDAIAGVVNIITKKHFSGSQISAYVGIANGSGNWDGPRQEYSFVNGLTSDRGHIMFAVSIRHSKAIPVWHRDFATYNEKLGNTRGSSYTPQGRFIFDPPSGGDPTMPGNPPAAFTGLTLEQCPDQQVDYQGQTLYLPHCDLTIRNGTSGQDPSNYRPFTPQDRWIGADAGKHTKGFASDDNTLTTNQHVKSIFTEGSYDILPSLTASFSALYTRRKTNANRVIGFASVTSPEATIAADNPYNPFDFMLSRKNAVEVAPGVYKPTLTAIYRRTKEFGLRNRIHKSRTLRLVGGLNGNFNAGRTLWDWSVDYIYSTNEQISAQTNSTNSMAMSLATSPQCDLVPGCVPLNWFGGQGVDGEGSWTPAQIDYIRIKHDIFGTESKDLRVVEANLSTPNLFDLPAGGLGFAVGAQHRNISGLSVPDPSGVTANANNTTPATVLKGAYDVNAVYAELNVPLVANVTGIKRLGVDLASRYAKYSTFGNTTNSRIGLTYQPVDDLLLRGSYSEGFRAGNLSELFSPLYTDFPYVNDPCNNYANSGVPTAVKSNCKAQGVPASYVQTFGQLKARYGGNPDVKPETSVSKSVGFVYSPSQLPGFSVNADYYHIDLEQTIGNISSQQMFNFCYRGGVQKYCDNIHRLSNGYVYRIDNLTTNIGGTTTAGIDLGLQYALQTDIGHFRFMLRGTRVNFYKIVTPRGDGTANVVRVVGDLDNDRKIPRWKGNFSVDYAIGPWTANIIAHYIEGMTGRCSDYLDGTDISLTKLGFCSNPNYENNSLSTNYRPSLTWWDVQLGYSTPWNVDFLFGVKNVFGQEPAGAAYGYDWVEQLDYGVYSRFVYGQVEYRF